MSVPKLKGIHENQRKEMLSKVKKKFQSRGFREEESVFWCYLNGEPI